MAVLGESNIFKRFESLKHTFNKILTQTMGQCGESSLTSDSIDFIKENQTSLLSPRHLKQFTHHPGPLQHVNIRQDS